MPEYAVFVLPVLVAALAIVIVLRRGMQFRRLLEDGIDASGVVVSKQRFHGRGGHTFLVRYEYRHREGGTHTHRSRVSREVFEACREAESLPIVYSAAHPEISAPRYLVDALRARQS